MMLEQTLTKMCEMRLSTMAGSLKTRTAAPEHASLSHEEFVGLIVDDEWMSRENKRLKMRLTQAKFKIPALPEEIDYQTKRGLNKSLMLELSTLKWVINRQNIVLTGPTGVGKSYLAQALGHQACLKGFGAHYVRLSKLLNELFVAKADGSYNRLLARLIKFDVLIIDDWGLTPLKEPEAQDLLDVIEERYEIKSTIVTSQLPIKNWHEFINNQTLADAILDRVVHNAYKIDLRGESMRKQKELAHDSR